MFSDSEGESYNCKYVALPMSISLGKVYFCPLDIFNRVRLGKYCSGKLMILSYSPIIIDVLAKFCPTFQILSMIRACPFQHHKLIF